jgi:DNA-binding MarR family transcriptional regulator
MVKKWRVSNNIMEKLESREVELWDLLTQVFRNGRRKLETELQKISMKPTELKVLHTISTEGATQMNSLADTLGITGPWITGIVEELASEGYVKKTRSKTDRRIISLSITAAGVRKLSEGMQIYNELLAEALSVLDSDRVQDLKDILELLNGSLK